MLLRGFVDRLDIAPDGRIRVVDYKGLALDTPLPTPSGWTTMGDVQVGDRLIGRDGQPTTVTLKSDVHSRPCYRVTFRDGASVVCDNVHLWPIVSSHRQVQTHRVVDTDTLSGLTAKQRASGRARSLWVEAAASLELPDSHELPIDPWLLGAWLGDGATRSGRLSVGRNDATDMLSLLKERWPRRVTVSEERSALSVLLARDNTRCAYGHTEFKPPTVGHPTRRCAHEGAHAAMTATNLGLTDLLRSAGLLGRKHIPPAYLRAGTEQRISLLRGLMDTDGWWSHTRHRAGFTTTDDQLAEGVVELLRTLGLHPCHFAKPYTNPKRPGRTWHVIEFTPRGFNPFALPRKAVGVRRGSHAAAAEALAAPGHCLRRARAVSGDTMRRRRRPGLALSVRQRVRPDPQHGTSARARRARARRSSR